MFDVMQYRTTRKVAICVVVPVSGSYLDLYYCKPVDVTVQAFSLSGIRFHSIFVFIH